MLTITPLPDDVDALKHSITQQQQMLLDKESFIDRMQTLLDQFQQQRFGAHSWKNPGQGELQFFNEAVLLIEQHRG